MCTLGQLLEFISLVEKKKKENPVPRIPSVPVVSSLLSVETDLKSRTQAQGRLIWLFAPNRPQNPKHKSSTEGDGEKT